MKIKFLLLLIGLALALPATRALAQAPAGGIIGSVHDFTSTQNSAYSWNVNSITSYSGTTATEYTCQVCHTPHGAQTSLANVPLWGHAISGTSGYTMYQSASPSSEINTAGVSLPSSPNGASLACLSCHDGTLAINQLPGNTYIGSTPGQQLSSSFDSFALIGKNLAGNHPISIQYPANFQFLQTPSTTLSSIFSAVNTTVTGNWPGTTGNGAASATINTLLVNGCVECESCHDVHKQIGDSVTDHVLLKIGQNHLDGTTGKGGTGRGDLLCRTCHIK